MIRVIGGQWKLVTKKPGVEHESMGSFLTTLDTCVRYQQLAFWERSWESVETTKREGAFPVS